MIRLYFRRAVLLGGCAAAAYALAVESGPWPAVLTCAAVAAVACTVGAILLRTSTIGRVTWRNRLAGYLIPWGWRLNRGKLWPLPVISWAVWTANGLAMNIPALLTSVSTWPNLATASPITRSATAGSAMSPTTVSTSAEVSGLIDRELATTR
jgi:hypothetical protein